MGQLAGSLERVYVPLFGPPGTDLTQYPVYLALVADNGQEPGSGDWVAADWLAPDPTRPTVKEAALLIGTGIGAVPYAPGTYMVFGRLTASDEQPAIKAGRWRIGL